MFFGCHQLDDPRIPVESGDVIKLEVVNENLEAEPALKSVSADSASSRLILATLQTKADGAQAITFQTTAGVLTKPGELPTASSGKSITITPIERKTLIQLHVSDVPEKEVIVAGSVATVANVVALEFTPHYPSNFVITPSVVNADKTADVSISIEAFCDEGKVSENQYFRVMSVADNGIIADHKKYVKLVNQKASFAIGNLNDVAGTVTLTIRVPAMQDSITKSVVIKYN